MEKYFLKNSAGVVGQKLSKHGFWNTDQRTSYFWVSKKLLCLLPSDDFEGMLFFFPLVYLLITTAATDEMLSVLQKCGENVVFLSFS